GVLAARAFVHLKARRPDPAIADYNACLSVRPEDPDSLFGLGLARYLKGDQPGGDREIAAARAQKPGIDDDMARVGLRVPDFPWFPPLPGALGPRASRSSPPGAALLGARPATSPAAVVAYDLRAATHHPFIVTQIFAGHPL